MQDALQLEPGTGACPEPKDDRDLLVRDAMAAGAIAPVTDADWKAGYSAYAEAGIEPEPRDQGGRLSCTCESAAQYARVLRKIAKGDDVIFAASSAYPFIRLPAGGAYTRDSAKAIVDGRFVPKTILADEDAAGNPLPESVVADKTRITAAIAAAGVKLDVFDSYRMADGSTDDMDVFAAAIRAGKGALLAFTGTNPGWSCAVCRHPRPGEAKWGHQVFGAEFGETDVEECGIPIGTRAIFTPNSWGSRNTFKTGRWKGRQAITAAYFAASEETAAGTAKGVYVFNAWTVLASATIPVDQWALDFIKINEGRIVQLTEPGVAGSGSMALILDGRFLVVTAERAGQAALTAYGRKMQQTIVGIDAEKWNRIPKTNF